ncbi:MAG: protein kinase domain-containing protein, partial [bacterium]
PSLADRLRDEGRLPVHEVVRLGAAVLSGLNAAHRRGLVHRDVKPSNILLPDDGGVKLADFGIATALAETVTKLTGTGELVGTPRYMAPECAAGQQATPASDLYAVAVLLYECLAGRAPFEADTPVAMAVAHQRDPVPPLASTAPHVPEPVAAVVEQGLAKDPTARFGDAETMRRALEGSTLATAADAAATTRPQTGGGQVASGAPSAGSRPAGRSDGARKRWLRAAVWVWVIAVVAVGGYLITSGGLGDASSDRGAASEGQEVNVFDLEVGDCTRAIPDTPELSSVQLVPCEGEHGHEVFAAVRMPGGDAYPGEDAVFTFARGECTDQFAAFVGLPPTLSELELRYFAPPESAWTDGQRQVLCAVGDPGAPVTGSLENAGR